MSGRLLLAAGLALALSGLVAASVAATRSPVRRPVGPPSTPSVRRFAGPPVDPVRQSAGPPIESILSRNLFAADRRAPPLRFGAEEPASHEPHDATMGTLTLVGVLLGAHRVAVVQGVPGASGDWLMSLGDSVGGYVLAHIDPRSVVMIRGGGRGSSDTLRLALKEVR